MALTNGSFNPSVSADVAKEIASNYVVIPAATNTAQVVNPTAPVEGVTVYNLSTSTIRATVTFVAGITATTVAADRQFIIPPAGVFSVDFSDNASDANTGAIDSISFQAVTVPVATTLSSALVAPAAITTAAELIVNFASA